MKLRLAAAVGVLLVLMGTPVSAHRLDEYLQATTISVGKDRVQAQMHLTPGVAVFPFVFTGLDTDTDGVLSAAEQRAYGERVRGDLSLTVDGARLPLRLASWKFAGADEMKDGRGEIELDFDAAVPPGGPNRRLAFENHHQSQIAVYLVNCLVPQDPDIRVTAQDRNFQQSSYQLDYVQTGAVRSGQLSLGWWTGAWGWLAPAALLLFAPLAWRWRQRARAAKNGVPANKTTIKFFARSLGPAKGK